MSYNFIKSIYTKAEGNSANSWSSNPSNGDTASANGNGFTFDSSRSDFAQNESPAQGRWVLNSGTTQSFTDGPTYLWDGHKWTASNIPDSSDVVQTTDTPAQGEALHWRGGVAVWGDIELVEDTTPQLGGELDAQSNKITSLGTPTASADAATKGYVDDNFVADAGGTMSGHLGMSGNRITNLGDPAGPQNAATKNYVDTTTTANPLYVAVAGDAMTGALAMGSNKITGLGAPTADTDASTKKYVDDEIADLVDSSPSTLDTLNELAAALDDDPNFATTVTNSIATKLPLAGGTMTGNIAMSGSQTVDGRDLSVDGAKLDGIEAGATADQTASEIKTLYESNSDTNEFSDAEQTKLAGIAAGAEVNVDTNLGKVVAQSTITVTSSTGNNVTLPLATLTSDTNKAGLFSPAEKTKLNNLPATVASSITDLADVDTSSVGNTPSNGEALVWNSSDSKWLPGGTIPTNNNQLTNGANYQAGVASSYSGTYNIPINLSNLLYPNPSGGAVTITGSTGQITTPNHGNSSQWNTAYGWGNHASAGYITSADGGNADTVDGYHASAFALLNGATFTNNVVIDNNSTLTIGDGAGNERLLLKKADNNVSDHIIFYNGTTRVGEIGCHSNNWLRINDTTNVDIYTPRLIRADGGFLHGASGTVWSSSNDGTGSGLDADKLDGIEGANYLRSDVADTMNSQLSGGFGAVTSSGTTDWNHISNARSGNGYTLLTGNASNGPGGSTYFHSLSFEYSSKNGTGNMTQFAIPYNGATVHFRYRYSGSWTGWYKIWSDANDGSGSGLDADKLDNLHASSFLRSDQSGSISGTLDLNTSVDQKLVLEGSSAPYIRFQEGTTNRAYLQFDGPSDAIYLWNQQFTTGLRIDSALSFHTGGYKTVWHAGNDGPGSGLDADTVDGLHASSFLQDDNGVILEKFGGYADGRSVTTKSGTYTLDTFTNGQTYSTSQFQTITGSVLAYTPPAGTRYVIYEFDFTYSQHTGGYSPLYHLRLLVNFSVVTLSEQTIYNGVTGHQYFRAVLAVNESTEDIANGKVGTWTSNKTFRLQLRNYSSSRTVKTHQRAYWNGSGSTADAVPSITITAIS